MLIYLRTSRLMWAAMVLSGMTNLTFHAMNFGITALKFRLLSTV